MARPPYWHIVCDFAVQSPPFPYLILRNNRRGQLADQPHHQVVVASCPSAWAWKLVLMRCRSTGTAIFCTSSTATKTAVHGGQGLAALDQELPGAGPAPQSTSSCTKVGAEASLGGWPAPAWRRIARCTRYRHLADQFLQAQDRLGREHLANFRLVAAGGGGEDPLFFLRGRDNRP